MHFSSLPSSIGLLTSLSTLCLNQGQLGDISIIGALQNLEILSLNQSDIRILPKEIGQLVKLKMLDVSRCTKLKTILGGVLSSLSRLEELYIGGTFIEWGVERVGNEQSNASLAELNTLSRLSTLEIQIPDAKAAPEDFFQELQKLERYKIFIGEDWEWEWSGNYKYSRTLKLRLSTQGIVNLDRGIKKLLKKTQDLHLDELKGVKIALQELIDEESLSHVKNLHIQNGLDIEYIIDDQSGFPQLQSLTLQALPQLISFCPQHKTGATSMPQQHELSLFTEKILLPCLEKLELSSINVTRIWDNQLSCTHEKLTTLKIDNCGNLKHLLSFSMAKCLVHLTDFEISECNSLREIIFTEDTEEEEFQATMSSLSLFPHLKSLKLGDLQHLIGFCSKIQTDQVIAFPSMMSLQINNCPELECFICRSTVEWNQGISAQVLFDNKVAFPSLREVLIFFLKKIKMIWEIPVPKNSFPKLQSLAVEGCDALLTIFPSNILTTFQGLQILVIMNCCSLEQVFEVESLNMHEENETALLVTAQLRELFIVQLPKLKYIWKNDPKGMFSFKNLRRILVRHCSSLKDVFPASVARDLPQLSDLEIANCGVEEVVSRPEGGSDSEATMTFEFDQISSLKLTWLPDCKCFCPGKHTTKWPMLTKLKAFGCGKMKIFGTQLMADNGQLESSIHPPLFMLEKVIPKLQLLTFGTDYIAMISDGRFSSSLFHEIKAFEVIAATSVYNFQISFLERFHNLEKLTVYHCEIKELFCTEGDTGNKETCAGTLSTIRTLNLGGLDNLKDHLWRQDVRVDHILPNLETLQVYNCKNLMSLGSSSALFQNLTTLEVRKCKGMKYLDTCLAIQGLAQLKKLMVRNCISMKEIVASESDEITCDIVFSRLKSLELVNLPRLESFCSGTQAFGFPCLEELIVRGCPELDIFCKGVVNAPLLQRVEYEGDNKGYWGCDLNNIVQHLHSTKVGYHLGKYLILSEFSKSIEIWKENIQGSLDFKKLKVLKVYECNSLKYIFSASMASDLVQLKKIQVRECPMMEQIIKKGAEETAMDTIMLPKLQSIKLESCSKLTSFCMGSITLQCPSLYTIEVDDCPKMYAMVSTEVVGCKKTPFFNHKVLCGNLEFLSLSETTVQKLWPENLHSGTSSNVQNLQVILVVGCHNLEYLFPSFLVKHFDRLLLLVLRNCENMEEVISADGLTAEGEEEEEIAEIYLFPKLAILKLIKLPKLGSFCHGDNSKIDFSALFNQNVALPCLNLLTIEGMGNCGKMWQWHDQLTTASFNELTYLEVKDCEKLSNILPFNLVDRLEKLETLRIEECESLEHIIGPDENHGLDSNESHTVTSIHSIELKSTTKFVFPKIRELDLLRLPKLKGFYSKVYTTEWPSLKLLKVRECNKIETFAGEYINFGEIQAEGQRVISVQKPLFWVTEETFPNLEDLLLRNMKEIWHGGHPKQYFCKLRVLKLTGFLEASVTVPNCFIPSLPNLEKLDVEKAALNELFPSEGVRDEDEDARKLAHLKELRLSELPELTHLCKKELSLARVLCSLEILQVVECGKLKSLAPPSVSFKHLTTLEVSKCNGLRNIVTFTIAKSMVQLTTLSVTDCQMLEEIVASTTDEEVMDGIVFSQLKSLQLDSLPSLSNFCSGNHTLVFPSLEEVITRQCPKMELFTKGELSTPMLHGVQSSKGEYVGHWEGDLNAIIQQLFVEKVFPSLEDLELSSINIQRAWNHKHLATHSYAQNLTCLTIEGCHNLSCLFSSSMVKCFVQLEKLNIENCENVENVIFVEGLSKEDIMNQKLFDGLEFLLLKDLPKLTRFCHGNYFEFPLLTRLSIESCPTLETFIFNAEGNNSEIASPALFD